MKDIKTLMIGFLLATCMFLLIGANSNNSQIGKYQGFADDAHKYLVDTETGQLWAREKGWDVRNNVWKENVGLGKFENFKK